MRTSPKTIKIAGMFEGEFSFTSAGLSAEASTYASSHASSYTSANASAEAEAVVEAVARLGTILRFSSPRLLQYWIGLAFRVGPSRSTGQSVILSSSRPVKISTRPVCRVVSLGLILSSRRAHIDLAFEAGHIFLSTGQDDYCRKGGESQKNKQCTGVRARRVAGNHTRLGQRHFSFRLCCRRSAARAATVGAQDRGRVEDLGSTADGVALYT